MRTLIRLFLVLVLVVFAGFLLLGVWTGKSLRNAQTEQTTPAVGTSGSIDTSKARERGAELGERAAIATGKVAETMAEAAVTTKIKTKMALDDTVKSRTIDVSTSGSTVTVSGTVRSAAEHDRAIQLARETSGVTRVVDHLQVK